MAKALGLVFLCCRLLAASEPAGSVGVYLEFENPPAPAAVAEMKRETERLMKAVSLDFHWRMLADNQGREAFHELVVLKFRGTCGPTPPVMDELEPFGQVVPLASTLVLQKRVLPFSDVECDQIRRVLPASGVAGSSLSLGVAMGRVVAHEMYHIFTNTLRHASRGVSRSTHSWRDLISAGARFDDSDTYLIRKLIRRRMQ